MVSILYKVPGLATRYFANPVVVVVAAVFIKEPAKRRY
jgi:hypothetical protein